MNKTERQHAIIDLIEHGEYNDILSTRQLADHFDVSEMTIRRDLQELSAAGKIRRQHGGARSRPTTPDTSTGSTLGRQIGILLSSRDRRYADPFFNEVLEGAENELRQLGYAAAPILTYAEVNTVGQARDLLVRHDLRGLLLLGEHTTDSLPYLCEHIRPIVSVTMVLGMQHDAVLINGYEPMRALIDHLVERGRRRIGFITGHYDYREQAYLDGIRAHGLPDEASLRLTLDYGFDGWSHQLGARGAARLMSLTNPPDAIVCASDRIALGVMNWLYEHSIRVPHEVAVTGFDNIPNAEFSAPGLTTIHVHKTLLGQLAAQRIVQRIEDPTSIPLHIQVPTELVIRASSNPRGKRP